MRLVLDCNILVSSISSRSPYHKIFQALVTGKFEIIVSNDILLEYEEIIHQKYSFETATAFMALLSTLPNVIPVVNFYSFNLITVDPDDNKYCDSAVSGNADYVVTEDNHFNVLSSIPFPKLSVLGINQFMGLI